MQLFLTKRYYKMFFLITHILIGKYYPSLMTQFIIGCTCYVLSFFIIKDIINNEFFEQYKYYALFLIVVDTTFIIYETKCNMNEEKTIKKFQNIQMDKKFDNVSTDIKNENSFSITLSSEMEDFKITHDLSLSESENENLFFSNSDEKNEKKIDIKKSLTSSDSINRNFDILK